QNGIDAMGNDAYTTSVASIRRIISYSLLNGSSGLPHIAENAGDFPNHPSIEIAALTSGGYYDVWQLHGDSQSAIADGRTNGTVGTPARFNVGAQKLSYLLPGLYDIGSLVATTAPHRMQSFNVEGDNPVSGYSTRKKVYNHDLQYSGGDVAMALSSGDNLYAVSDTSTTASYTVFEKPTSVSAGKLDASGNWVSSSTKTVTDNGNGSYSFTASAKEALRISLPAAANNPPAPAPIPDPGLETALNIAPSAKVTASSVFDGAHGVGYVNDNSEILSNEWASYHETSPSVTLTWPSPVTLSKLTFYDRVDPNDNANGGTVTFSDGSTVAVSNIDPIGQPTSVSFAERTVTSLTFRMNGSGQNVGLEELRAFAGPSYPRPASLQKSGTTTDPSMPDLGWWKLDEVWGNRGYDSSLQSGILSLTDVAHTTGTDLGNAAGLNGTSSYARIPMRAYSYPGTTATYSLWAYAGAANTGAQLLGGSAGAQSSLALDANGRLTGSITQSNGTAVTLTDTATFPRDSWQLVTLVADGSKVTLYRNGLPRGSAGYSGQLKSAPGALGIGARLTAAGDGPATSNTGYWNGKIDDVRLYSAALTPATIRGIYTGQQIDGANLAPDAQVSVSSQESGVNPASNLVDENPSTDWSSTEAKPSATLTWSSPRTIDRVVLSDRAGSYQWAKQGTLTFSDGSTAYAVRGIPDDGSATTFTFPSRTVTWVKFTVDQSVSSNVGLSEFQVFGPRNVARDAVPTSSSVYQPSIEYNTANVSDGNTSGGEGSEWASNGETRPTFTLTWPTAQVLDHVVLYDRPNTTDNANSGTLTFSDGSTVPLTGIATDGKATEYTFAPRSTTKLVFSPTGGTGSNVGLAEIEAFGTPDVARLAKATASSTFASGQPTWQPAGAIDGVIEQNDSGEWASNGERNPWLRLDWSSPVTVSRFTINGRANGIDTAVGGTLTFNDGSTQTVSGIPANGTTLTVTLPAAKTITSVRFQITGSAGGSNVGLSELGAFRS
ncbi:MAG: discoidin domain-containing protein, partial [Williamsia herbipolensis]|nr:discoidin domain-containing protein [Williamsia herbipolensis]